MPFRLDDFRAKIQFVTSAAMPHMIYRACKATNTVSATVYCQRAIAEALARDLNMDVQVILDGLPTPRGPSGHLFDPDNHGMARYPVRIGPGNTVEDIGD